MLQKHFVTTVGLIALLSNIPAALAQTSEEILAEHKSFLRADYCEKKVDRGQCISDVLKKLQVLKKEFEDALKDEKAAWIKAYDDTGKTIDDYRNDLRAFVRALAVKRKAFNEQDQAGRKLFFNQQKTARSSAKSSSSSSTYTRRITASETAEARRKCEEQGRSSKNRTCIRHMLQLIDPAAVKRSVQRRVIRVRGAQ